MIDLNALLPWFSLVLAAASFWYAISNNRSKDTSEKFEAIDLKMDTKATKDETNALAQKVDKVEDRVTVVENDLRHLPDKDATHRIELAMADLRTELRAVSEGMKPIKAIGDRLQDFVLDNLQRAASS